MLEVLRCEDVVCPGCGVQGARLRCRTGTHPAPRRPPSHARVGNGMVLGPSSRCCFSLALLQGSGVCVGLCGSQIPPQDLWGVCGEQPSCWEVSKPWHRAPERILQPGMCCTQQGEGKQGGMGCVGFAPEPRVALFLDPLSKDMSQPLCSSAPAKFNPTPPRARCGDRSVALRTC